jgi:hypothetical protein
MPMAETKKADDTRCRVDAARAYAAQVVSA